MHLFFVKLFENFKDFEKNIFLWKEKGPTLEKIKNDYLGFSLNSLSNRAC
jgi:hypothetical protein